MAARAHGVNLGDPLRARATLLLGSGSGVHFYISRIFQISERACQQRLVVFVPTPSVFISPRDGTDSGLIRVGGSGGVGCLGLLLRVWRNSVLSVP